MGSEEYHLKWNDYNTSFAKMIQGSCLQDEMADCTISNGSRSFSLHRMILATCSTYLRSLFNSIPYDEHPLIVVSDMQDEIVEMLIGYMYSGEVSVTQEDIVPLLNAAKSLGIKGLLDVPMPTSTSSDQQQDSETQPRQVSHKSRGPPPLKKLKPNANHSVTSTTNNVNNTSSQKICDTNKFSKINKTTTSTVKRQKLVLKDPLALHQLKEENLDPIPVEPLIDSSNGDMTDHDLLSQLTDEMTAYSLVPGGADTDSSVSSLVLPQLLSAAATANTTLAAAADKANKIILAEPRWRPDGKKKGSGENAYQMVLYSCSHCGKEFTSKRKHQRHVLNVHFRYNPVQCPFCQKGHRDNYNLKQHVCPVINMKYGLYKSTAATNGTATAGGGGVLESQNKQAGGIKAGGGVSKALTKTASAAAAAVMIKDDADLAAQLQALAGGVLESQNKLGGGIEAVGVGGVSKALTKTASAAAVSIKDDADLAAQLQALAGE